MTWKLQFSVILAALRRHKSNVSIICLQIAFTMAVMANLVFVIGSDMQRYHSPTGVDEADVGVIQSIGAIGIENTGTALGSLYALRGVAGVANAAIGLPPLWRPNIENLYSDVDRIYPIAKVYHFRGSQGYSDTLGVRVIAGRNLTDEDAPDFDSIGSSTVFPALITQALAERLFQGRNPLGQQIIDGSAVMRVIGVIASLRAQVTGADNDDYAILTQFKVGSQNIGGAFVIRAVSGKLNDVLKKAASELAKANPGHVTHLVKTVADLREDYFRSDRAKNQMITLILVILLTVSTFGIAGISAYWVQQRRRQIGVRRALGATRSDILFYFQAENLLIVTIGLVVGIAMTYLGNHLLISEFEVRPIPLPYVLFSAIAVLALGQVAVLVPALQAAKVEPSSVIE
jgi:putative ABC transport system permease protein